jgi:outer membrane protein OmpA-like peptidoglycan-associated protein
MILPAFTHGQFSFLDDPYSDIELEFLRKKIEIEPDEPFFNVLKIVNPTDRRLQFNTNISLPRGWSLMVEQRKLITLNPNDSILIPVRASADRKAKGDIGYALVASLSDNKGTSFKNEYSFINIPKKNNISFRPEQRQYYINNVTKKTSIKLNLLNKGNVDELVFIDIAFDKPLIFPNKSINSYRTEVLLPVNNDTAINIEVLLGNAEIENSGLLNNYQVKVKAYTKDTIFTSSIWLKKADSDFENIIPDRHRLLILDFSMLNLFSEYEVGYTGIIKGSFLTRKAGSFYYRLQTMGAKFEEDPIKYSRIELKYDYKNFSAHIGDVGLNIEQSAFGRGALLKYRYKENEISAIGIKNIFNQNEQFGGVASIKPFKQSKVDVGGVYSDFKLSQEKNVTGLFGFGTSLIKNIRLYARAGLSQTTFNNAPNEERIGLGGQAQLYIKYPRVRISNFLKYGDRNYNSFYAGRLKITSKGYFKLNNRLDVALSFNLNNIEPPIYENYKLLPGLYSNNSQTDTRINYIATPTISIFAGQVSYTKKSNNFYNFDQEREFFVPTAQLIAGAKFRSKQSPLNFTIKSAYGYSIVTGDPDAYYKPPVNETDIYPSFEISAMLQGKNWSIYTAYLDGPYTIKQHFEYVYSHFETKQMRLMPQFDIFLYKDIIKFSNRSSFTFNIESKTNRYSFGSTLSAYPGYGFTIDFINTYGYQSSLDITTDEKYTYNNAYFELRVQKKFGFNQPRVKYYDLNVVFFKDLNGDNIKGENEPGIENVLTKIDIDHTIVDSMEQYSTSEGGFYAVELLSGSNGHVKYDNIPSGFYLIKYVSLGKMQGNFSSDRSSRNVLIDGDKTIYIPYRENNKIFGSVFLNRSKLSNLGNISAANIKVTATDSKGNIYSTLTDKNGEFVLYVPNVDKYKVRMNNIFFEHFNLEQNDYTVELNGYRQFEINFILNEKRRRINFSNNLDLSNQERNLRVIKRTNLGGSVKDAATFKPISAEVKIIDSKTSQVVTSANSDRTTGQFYVSYLAGKEYKLVVTSDGYWFYSENMPSNQITTFQNIKREIMLDYITVGSKVNLQAITFEPDQDNLTPESMAELDRLAGILQNNPDLELEIVGHCDAIEAVDKIEVAENRAKSVMTYLMKKGFKNLRYSSAGNSQPLNEGNTEEERAKNRRVEAIVIAK